MPLKMCLPGQFSDEDLGIPNSSICKRSSLYHTGIRISRDLDISVLNICDISVLGTGHLGTGNFGTE